MHTNQHRITHVWSPGQVLNPTLHAKRERDIREEKNGSAIGVISHTDARLIPFFFPLGSVLSHAKSSTTAHLHFFFPLKTIRATRPCYPRFNILTRAYVIPSLCPFYPSQSVEGDRNWAKMKKYHFYTLCWFDEWATPWIERPPLAYHAFLRAWRCRESKLNGISRGVLDPFE